MVNQNSYRMKTPTSTDALNVSADMPRLFMTFILRQDSM